MSTVGPGSPLLLDGNEVFYTPSPAEIVNYYDGNLTPQSAANIQAVINTVFGLSGPSAVGTTVSGCESTFADCTNAWAAVAGGVYSNAFTSALSYDYLAIHFGQGELIFHWTAPVAAGTTFMIGGLPHGLSNYRAFLSPVPEPGTYAMLLAGLGLMGALARRRR